MKHALDSLQYVDYPVIQLMYDAECLLTQCGTRADHDHTFPRSAVSALFAGIEGSLFVLKQVFHDIPEFRNRLSEEEFFLLRDKTPVLSDKGEVVLKDAFLRVDANVRFLEGISNRLLGTALDIVHSKHWAKFHQAIRVRNRIMHPKRMEDMGVSDEELKLMYVVFDMFVGFFAEIIQALKTSNKANAADR